MTRWCSLFPIITGLAVVAGLAGCPDDPYKAETWIKKLSDSHESERAVTELEQLGNPIAIDALGNTWVSQGKPVRLLQVIIALARPLTPEQAIKGYFTDYQVTGRPASWDKAGPFLKKALTEVDDTNPRSVDSATKAADALGESRLPDGLDALIEIAQKPVTKKLITAQIAAIRAIGKYNGESTKAAAALTRLIDKDPPPNPRAAKEKDQTRGLAEKYSFALAVSGAAINALGDLHVASSAKVLVLSMFRMPELFAQIRRALVASGPVAAEELRKVLAGTHPEVNQLVKDKHLDRYCGDKNESLDQCLPVSALTFYPAVVLGDFYDPKSVPVLLAALKQPPIAVYYVDDQPSPNTQYNAIFDALRKIGAPEGAATVRAMWMAHGADAKPARGGKRGAEPAQAPGQSELTTRLLAIGAYPFLTRDDAGTDDLGKIAADNNADERLRQESATAFARLAHDAKDISVLQALAQKYADASAKKRGEADGKPKGVAEAADKEFAKAKKLHDDAIHGRAGQNSGDDIKAAIKKADTAYAEATKLRDQAVEPYKSADALAKQYKGYARMFQTHIARIEIAIRCKQDLNCYGASLKLKPAEAAKNNAPYIRDIKDWTADEQLGLVEANVERAMLEIGKRGAQAAKLTETLLDSAKNDNRLIRQSILLALPKIAAVPCADCEAKLQAAIRAGEGKTTLVDLNLETTMMKNYFGWAGGKTPSVGAADKEKDELPVSADPKPARKKK
jgi:flagellar hook-basal body complex protein FliE